MKKSLNKACFVILLLLLCVGMMNKDYIATQNASYEITDSFLWKAYAYTPITNKPIYNYGFPSERVNLTEYDKEQITQMLANCRIKKRLPKSWTPYGLNIRIPCVIVLEIKNDSHKYEIFLCKDLKTEILLLKHETSTAVQWYNLQNSKLLSYLDGLYPYDTTGNTVTHIAGRNE